MDYLHVQADKPCYNYNALLIISRSCFLALLICLKYLDTFASAQSYPKCENANASVKCDNEAADSVDPFPCVVFYNDMQKLHEEPLKMMTS